MKLVFGFVFSLLYVFFYLIGLTADARILIDRARIECQSHKLTVEDPVTIEYITRFIAQLKQKYTQSNGRRPFGISCLIAGFDDDGSPRLFQTDPSGKFRSHVAWNILSAASLCFVNLVSESLV